MNNILELLESDLGKQLVDGISSKTSATATETKKVLEDALPSMVSMLHTNSQKGNVEEIEKALDQHNGSILDNISSFFDNNTATTKDGNGILGHIFGDKLDALTKGISQKSGVATDKTSKIISMAAPIVMEYIGKIKASSGNNNITNILSDIIGNGKGKDILNSILDQNNDGKLGLDDITSAISKGKSNKKGGVLGTILNMFKK